jgi:preprotein translocase subunit SecE
MATTQVETVSTSADKAKLGAAVALVIAALAGFYLLGKQGQVAQWGALLVGLAAAFVVVMALFLWVTDKTLEWALYDLILGWKR